MSRLLVALLLIIAPCGALAATKAVRSPVYGILTGPSYGGCMLQIGEIPADAGLDCPIKSRTWLTMDCNGQRLSKDEAANNLKLAQMAILTKDKITITIDDSFKASGWCLGRQIILFR